LFTTMHRALKGHRLTGDGVAVIIAELAQEAGLEGHVRPHGLRHASITHALDATGGDVRAVQRHSRHRDVKTLQLYDDNRTDLAGRVAALVALSV
jgi:integrase/recombinase XerC